MGVMSQVWKNENKKITQENNESQIAKQQLTEWI